MAPDSNRQRAASIDEWWRKSTSNGHRAPSRAGDSHEMATGRERESAGKEPAEEEGRRFDGGCAGRWKVMPSQSRAAKKT